MRSNVERGVQTAIDFAIHEVDLRFCRLFVLGGGFWRSPGIILVEGEGSGRGVVPGRGDGVRGPPVDLAPSAAGGGI